MDTAESIVEGAREASESAQQVADNFQQAVDRSVRDQPLTTLALGRFRPRRDLEGLTMEEEQ